MISIDKWLPPNIDPPLSKPCIQTFIIGIRSIKYLQNLSYNATYISYKWWGDKTPDHKHPLQTPTTHMYALSVPIQNFLSYLQDMRILQLQVYNQISKMPICKGYINLQLYRGWKGQFIQLQVPIKNQKGSKIGEIEVSMQIGQAGNPRYANTQSVQQDSLKYPCEEIPSRDHDVYNSSKNIKNINKGKFKKKSGEHIQNHIDINNNINFLNYNTQIDNIEQRVGTNNPARRVNGDQSITKSSVYRRLNLPLPDPCICPDLNPNKYNLQKLKLKQQVDIFFNQSLQYSNIDVNKQEGIQYVNVELCGLELAGTVKKFVGPCRVSVPAVHAGSVVKNQYSFAKGIGTIPIIIDYKQFISSSNPNQRQNLKQFLTNNCIQIFTTGQSNSTMHGNIPLYRVIGSKGNIISIGMHQRAKNGRQVLKGHYYIKLMPNHTTNVDSTFNKGKINPQINKNNDRQNKQAQQMKEHQINKKQVNEQYVWIYLQKMNFLQPHHWANSNVYGKLAWNKTIEQTKTIWNTQYPVFNQILTLKVPPPEPKNQKSNPISLQFWNRQATQRLIGTCLLQAKEMKQYNNEIPVKDYNGRVIAYVGMCWGTGTIEQALGFLNTHANMASQRGHHNGSHGSYGIPNSSANRYNNTNNVPYSSPRTQNIHNNSEQPYNSPRSHQHQTQPQPSHQQQQQKQQQQSQQNSQLIHNIEPSIPLTLIQLHSKILYQYMRKQFDWFSTYQNAHPSISQFIHLSKPLFQGLVKVGKAQIKGIRGIEANSEMMRFVSLYLGSSSNVSLEDIRESYQAYLVYFQMLVNQRDQLYRNIVDQLNQQGISINQLQTQVSSKIRSIKNQIQRNQEMWRFVKLRLSPKLIEQLRYFTQHHSQLGFQPSPPRIQQICDSLRRFQVFESTKDQQIPVSLVAVSILREISDLLNVDTRNKGLLRQAIAEANLTLSLFELLCIFGQDQIYRQALSQKQNRVSDIKGNDNNGNKDKQLGMIKSPTFGLLNSDRIGTIPRLGNFHENIEHNPSINTRIGIPKIPEQKSQPSRSGLSNLSQKFGYPNISPISQQNRNNKPSTVSVNFMDMIDDEIIQQIYVNGQQFRIDDLLIDDNGSILMQLPKAWIYEGWVIMEGGRKLEFEGPPGEWVGLVDPDGAYCGSLCFE